MNTQQTILEPYNPAWTLNFHAFRQVYTSVLSTLAVAIEHVGSTAIPGIYAKPIIDIDIVIEDRGKLLAVSNKLAALGYRHNGDQGILGREVFKRLEESVPYTQPNRVWINHHLYVCAKDSAELARHLAFRDFLRGNEPARVKYERIKLDIAKRSTGDRKQYAAIKEVECRGFVEGILARAANNGKA